MPTRKHGIVSGIAVAAVAVAVFGADIANTFTPTSPASSCIVTGKDHAYTSEGSSRYRVYTSNCGVFEVQDSVFHGQFRSADTYGSIQNGHTYDFTTYGIRFGFLGGGLFPNILKATPTR